MRRKGGKGKEMDKKERGEREMGSREKRKYGGERRNV